MDLKGSKTYENLAKSFIEECTSGMKYQFTAQLAMQQGYSVLADEIKQIAKNETKHAKVFFDYIIEAGNEIINVCGDFPFFGTDLADGLKTAIETEEREANMAYPEFMRTALDEGFTQIAHSYELIIEVEKQHREKFKFLYENFINGTLYTSDEKKTYVCSECGYTKEGTSAWNMCPLCSANQGFVAINPPENKDEKN